MLSNFLTYGENINELFQNFKNSIVYFNIYYKANDFINHGPHLVNFGESFKELVDQPFAFYVLYFEIFVRIYVNQLKIVSDFIVFNYYRDNDKQSFRHLEKVFYNVYCIHLKKLINDINSIMKPNIICDIFNSTLNKKIKYNDQPLLILDSNYFLDE